MVLKRLFLIQLLLFLLTLLHIEHNVLELLNNIIITNYKYLCYGEIYNTFVQQEYREMFGTLEIRVGHKRIPLNTAFYENFIVKQEYIIAFLKDVTWLRIIKENKFNCIEVCNSILILYKNHINQAEIVYNQHLLSNINIRDAENHAMEVLYNFIENDLIIENKKYFLSLEYLRSLLQHFDLPQYMKTKDFQLGDYFLLKDFCHHEILKQIQQSIIIIDSKDVNINSNFIWIDQIITALIGITLINALQASYFFTEILFNYLNYRYGSITLTIIDQIANQITEQYWAQTELLLPKRLATHFAILFFWMIGLDITKYITAKEITGYDITMDLD